MKIGKYYKPALEFEKIQNDLIPLIQLSNVKKMQLIKKIRISESNFYRRLQNRNFTADQIVRIFTALIEMQNLEHLKNQ